jgi:hypothetical protein
MRYWRWPILALWVAGTVLLFGPISDATGSLNPPPVEGAVQDVITVGMLITIVLILFGLRMGALLGAMCAAGGIGVGVADIPPVGDVGIAEVGVFSVLLAASLYGWHLGGVAQALERERARAEQHDGVVALRRFRVSRHHPRLEIQGTELLIRVPVCFGARPWRVPVREVAASNPAVASNPDPSSGVVFKDAVRIPYLFTTGAATTPNLLLLFAEPCRAPRLRWSRAINASTIFGSLRQRLRGGAQFDGVMLRCADPEEAIRTLNAAGVEVTYSPDDWLAQHRHLVVDEAERQDVLSRADRSRNLNRIAAAVSVIGGIILLGSDMVLRADHSWAIAACLGSAMLAGIMRAVARRGLRR